MSLRPLLQLPLAHGLRTPLRSTLHPLARNAFSTTSKAPLRLTARVQSAKFSSTSTSSSFTSSKSSTGRHFYVYAGVAGLGLGVAFSTLPGHNQPVHCEAPPPRAAQPQPLPPPPESAVNLYELSFGTVAGLCAGVFVKKGAKIVGFFLGGIFVLLQYFANASLIRVDWSRFASRFENLFYTTTVDARTGETVKKAPTVGSLVRWIVDFLTADFQQRASFVAGFALGLRLG